MVATATNIKTPALPATLEVNGTAMATPAGAVGIVGKLEGNDLFVVRNGQTVNLRAGDWLLEGDRVVTSSAAEQTLYFAGDAAGSLRRVQFARGADFKIRNGEIYTTSLMTSSMVTAAEALPQSIVAAGADEVALADEEAPMAVEETSSLSGLFGTPVAMGAAGVASVAGAGLALTSLLNNDSSDPTAAPAAQTNPSGGNGSGNGDAGGDNTDGGNMDGGNGGEPAPDGGAFSSGGAQLDGLFADNPTGQTPPFSFADGGAMLEGASPVPLAAPAGDTGGPAAAVINALPVTPTVVATEVPAELLTSTASDTLSTLTSATPSISSAAIDDVLAGLPIPSTAL